jgi:hypothetical protein
VRTGCPPCHRRKQEHSRYASKKGRDTEAEERHKQNQTENREVAVTGHRQQDRAANRHASDPAIGG